MRWTYLVNLDIQGPKFRRYLSKRKLDLVNHHAAQIGDPDMDMT